jgi:hypothetical protein
MITFQCPSCGKQYSVKDEHGGRKTVCRSCQTSLTVPTAVSVSKSPVEAVLAVEANLVKSEPQSIRCPFCDETISRAAKKCKHCGETVDVALRAAEEAKRAVENKNPMVFMNAGGASSSSSASAAATAPVVVVQAPSGFGHWHGIHLVLTFFTCGAWAPIWLIHWLIWQASH